MGDGWNGLDVEPLVQWQRARDRERAGSMQTLVARKRQKMSASVHAFVRGAAPLFYRALSASPWDDAPPGIGWIVGDAHMENFGAYRDTREGDRVAFDLNDFDDATHGPFWLDVIRFLTSLLCVHVERDAFSRGLTSAELALESYARTLAGDKLPAPPACVVAILTSARSRTRDQMVRDRTVTTARGVRLVRDDRYLDLPDALAKRVSALIRAYITELGPRAPGHLQSYDIVDSAWRIAGNGSLGAVRIVLLVEGNDTKLRLIEFKQAFPSCVDELLTHDTTALAIEPSQRVVRAAESMLASPARHVVALGAVWKSAPSLVGRVFSLQQDKIELSSVTDLRTLHELALYEAALLGQAHKRGATQMPNAPWTPAQRAQLVERAIVLAGLHAAAHRAWTRLE